MQEEASTQKRKGCGMKMIEASALSKLARLAEIAESFGFTVSADRLADWQALNVWYQTPRTTLFVGLMNHDSDPEEMRQKLALAYLSYQQPRGV